MIEVNNFEEQYLLVRQKENRLYSDEQVRWLPDISKDHPHHKEWQIRADSCTRLFDHLLATKLTPDILEIGCGNGWLSHQLSKIPGSNVAGIDINKTELDQAKRVFDQIENLEFIYVTIDDERLREEKFDAIVFAASIQYFPSLAEIVTLALQRLKSEGEIHIVDTNFYRSHDLDTARARSMDYYRSLQFPGMSNHYFHHTMEELEAFRHKILYRPGSLLNRFLSAKNPFPWICIYDHA